MSGLHRVVESDQVVNMVEWWVKEYHEELDLKTMLWCYKKWHEHGISIKIVMIKKLIAQTGLGLRSANVAICAMMDDATRLFSRKPSDDDGIPF